MLVFVWPYALIFWAAFAWALLPERQVWARTRAAGKAAGQDRGSLWLIMLGNELSIMAALGVAVFCQGATMALYRKALFVAGVVAVVAGGALRRHCLRMLGPSFTGRVIVRPAQAVVERGAYRWVRHPSYTGALLIFIGMGLALTNWLSLLVLALASVMVYAYRILAEERARHTTLGEPYRDYMRRTKRLVPFVL